MKILIIDRDAVTANLFKSRLEPLGHSVKITEKNEGLDKVVGEGWDIIMIDPSPVTNVKPMLVNVRRCNRRNAYMILLSDSLNYNDALLSGFNNFLSKPCDMNLMLNMVGHARILMDLQRYLSDADTDFPNAGGVIAKSAFNQLFLSSMERADRYGEQAHIIFVAFDNYSHIFSESGEYEANVISAKLAQHLVRLRRQTDIIAQIRNNEYALLLLRPMTESEPIEAANRFAESLSKCTDLPLDYNMAIDIKVTLMRLPTGEIPVEHRMDVRRV